MTPKPAYLALDRLINHEWRTNIECECESEFSFRGFYGEYEIEVTENGKTETYTVMLDKNGKVSL
jgi:hypothetical protein